MTKKVIFSILFSAVASVAAFAQSEKAPVAAPTPKKEMKDDKNTGLERTNQKTADKPGKGNEAVKDATQRKMNKDKANGKSGQKGKSGKKGKSGQKGHKGEHGKHHDTDGMEKKQTEGSAPVKPAPSKPKAPKTSKTKAPKTTEGTTEPKTRTGGSQK